MVDLDDDGFRDVISGSWPGEIFIFRGGKDGAFGPPEMIRDKEGEYINIGGGISEREDGGILIRGNAKFVETDEGVFVDYHGKRMESTPEKPIAISGTASAVHATDWDGDGDLDLLVGDIRGGIHLVPNEREEKGYAFGEWREIGNVDRDAGPFAADWDGDGDLDLLSGAADGSVTLFENMGSEKSPTLREGVVLVPKGTSGHEEDSPTRAARGRRSKICAADWNGDGKLDLLLGDYGRVKLDLPEPTEEEKAEHERIREELNGIREKLHDLQRKIRKASSEERKELEKEVSGLYETMSDLRSKLPQEYESHGWIWLFLRT